MSTPATQVFVTGPAQTNVVTVATPGPQGPPGVSPFTNIVVGAPPSGTAIVANAAPNAAAIVVNGAVTLGQSYGITIEAGTNSSDYGLVVQSNGQNILLVRGDGSGVLGWNGSANTIVFSAPGNITINGNLGVNGNAPPAQSTGWGTPTGGSVANNFSGSAATLAQTSAAVAQLISVLKALGVLGA